MEQNYVNLLNNLSIFFKESYNCYRYFALKNHTYKYLCVKFEK